MLTELHALGGGGRRGSQVNLTWVKLFQNLAILEMTFLCGPNLTLTCSITKKFQPWPGSSVG